MKITRLSKALFSLLFLTIVIGSAFPLKAAPGDQYWDIKFGLAGTTNALIAVTTQNGTLYAGGFNSAASTNTPLNYWDGYQWQTAGLFNNGTGQAFLYSAAFVGNTLYVGGAFTNVNGVAANGLAAWNGSTWSSVGFSGAALTLAVSGNTLYVGGVFTNRDNSGVVMTNVGYWDGSAWHAMGGGLGVPGTGPQIIKLLVNGSSVYAGGAFTGSGSVTVSNLAVWNGSVWQAVGTNINGAVEGLAFSGGNLYAGGIFTTPQSEIAEWNGTSWIGLGSGMNGAVASLATFNNQIYAAGTFTQAGGVLCTNFAIWNGATWSPTGTGLGANPLREYSTGTNVYVVGNFASANNIYVNDIASWDGTRWNPIGTPGRTNGLSFVATASGTDGTNLYAGGSFTFAGIVDANYVARFDGQKWNSLGTGMGPPGGITIVDAIAVTNNNVYVGGAFSSAGGVTAANMARWDGTNWSALGNGPGGQVWAISVQTSGVYVAGAPFSTGNNLYGAPFFEVWNGTNWASAGTGNPTNSFFAIPFNTPAPAMDAIAFIGTNEYIGGYFYITTITPSQSSQGILRSDGTYVYPVGNGFNSNVVALAVINTNLYAAGNFTNSSGYPLNHIAMWDGINWTNLGSGVVGKGTVFSLGTIGNYLFAGGSFTNMGGVAANGIAEWDGTNWYGLGSGVNFTSGSGAVDTITAIGPDLYVGGTFRFAGLKPSYFIGHWNNQVNFNAPQVSNPARENNGYLGITVSGVNGMTNIVLASTNLTAWTPVYTNTAGICVFTDSPSASFTQRFYRASLSP